MLKQPFLFLLIWIVHLTGALGQNTNTTALNDNPIFPVYKTTENIVIDGKMKEKAWEHSHISTLDYFYRLEHASDKQQTTFRMLWDDKNLYLFYHMEDKFLTAKETKRDGKPYLDDCAEIFIIPAPESLATHFGYELNLYKASNDFLFFNNYYNEINVVFHDFNPDFSVEISYEGTINDNSDIDKGWTMELAIPLSNFGSLGRVIPAQPGNQWAFLVIRQDRNELHSIQRTTSTNYPIHNISKSTHQPDKFGLLEFRE